MNDDPSAMHVAYLGVQDPADQVGSVQKLQQLCTTAVVDAYADAGLLLSRDERCCTSIYVVRYHVPPARMHGIVSIHAMCMRWPIMTNPLLMALRRLGMLIVYGYWSQQSSGNDLLLCVEDAQLPASLPSLAKAESAEMQGCKASCNSAEHQASPACTC